MLQILIYFFIAVSLSVDAFSLSLSLGTISPTRSQILRFSLIVGIFHFIMPLLGSYLGSLISTKIIFRYNIISFLIFFYLAIEMLKNRHQQEKYNYLNISTMFLIALTVSIDSFSVGVAIGITKESIIIASIIFMIISSIFTIMGLILGKILKTKYHDKATMLGIILLLLVSLKYLLNY